MTNFQAVFDAIMAQAKQEHLQNKSIITLGALQDILRELPQDAPVKVQYREDLFGYGGLESYRGYYSDLSINIEGGTSDVQELLADLEKADGAVFEGYKGGEYTMRSSTLVWADFYSCASGQGVTGAKLVDGTVVITTADCE